MNATNVLLIMLLLRLVIPVVLLLSIGEIARRYQPGKVHGI